MKQISNALFFIYPPILCLLSRQYANRMTSGVYVVWMLLVVVGIGSVYFHATLSLAGQLLDEIAIIWVVIAAAALWWPRDFIPWPFKNMNKNYFKNILASAGIKISFLAFVYPAINAFVLFIIAVPITSVLILRLKR